MSYADKLDTVTGQAEQALAGLLERLEAGDLTEEQFIALAVAAVVRVNARAVAFADVALAADLTARTGTVVPPLGLAPDPGDADRLGKAMRTVLDGPAESRPTRLARLAREEPLSTAAEARGKGMEKSRRVAGWTRGLSADACPACTGWAGPVLPAHARMARHTGCSCVQIPTIKEK